MSVTHMSMGYDFGRIEAKWQQFWERQRSFRALNPGPVGADRPKFYVLDFFPYPSGAGLHVGHPLGYIASDILARHLRMRGYNVLHPMGWDAFGLPAEQYAIETGIHPAITTRKNIENYQRQLRMIGLGYDWDREITTCDPDYYRWTQWIFLQIFNSWYDPEWRWVDDEGRPVQGRARRIEELPIPDEVRAAGELALEEYRNEHRLAFRAEVPVNWCPALGTVLANEEVTADGRSERGDHPVYRRPMKQWMLRITEYADRLLSDLEPLDWPEPIKLMQRNWIGRSTGAYVDFRLEAGDHVIRVFTTRPDTLFGATYMVLAPEHRLVPIITTSERRTEVETYVEEARKRGELERSAAARTKTGVFTGGYAVNPVNRQRIPIWVADYVLAGYGTGSIMAVPGHDQRDLEFARTFGLPVVQVVQTHGGVDWQGFEGDGVAMASPPTGETATDGCNINGLSTPDAKKKITAWLEEHELGEGTVQYKLRDWLFSRQRYWGEPFPIAYAPDGRILGIPNAQLPVELPAMEDFRPVAGDDPRAEPQTPLSRAGTWVEVTLNGQVCHRELNTMPQWAGSCWYYLRFIDADNAREFVDPRAERYWMTGCADKRPAAPCDAAARPESQGRNSRRIGGVDLYIGGAEHAVLHLLYARFWHKVLYDLGHVSTPEPFQKLFNQGMIQAAAFRDSRGVYVEATEVVDDAGHRAVDVQDKSGPFFHGGRPVTREFGKMGKSLKNVVNPDAIIADYGADTLRLYEMYMGPLEASKPWNTRDMIGVHRFLQRVWRLVVEDERQEGAEGSAGVPPAMGMPAVPPNATGSAAVPPNKMGSAGVPPAMGMPAVPPNATGSAAVLPNKMGSAGVPPATASRISARIAAADNPDLEKPLHKAIKKVSEDLERFAFNTAIAQLIVWCNEAQRASQIGRGQVERFLRLLAPFAPHICEELWERLGQTTSITQAEWPMFDEALTRDATVEIAVQVNGKIRARLQAPLDADDQTLTALALADETVKRFVGGRAVRKTVVVRNRLVNFIL